uniref:tetratricopeptide repeat protein n=2 Tax=Rhizorhapis sp. SPR117 TaxID=2912611 RepID=UPI0030C7D80A
MIKGPNSSAVETTETLLEKIMRFTPASVALALVLATVSSAGNGQKPDMQIDPLSVAWVQKGEAAQKLGKLQDAIDAYETALAVDPRNRAAFSALGEVARIQGLTGKSIRLYREALLIDPTDLNALGGQGEAMVDKGAIEKAKENLAKMKTICRSTCGEVVVLATAIEKGSAATQLTAKDVGSPPAVTAAPKAEKP